MVDFSDIPAAASAIPEPAQMVPIDDLFPTSEPSFAALAPPAPAKATVNPIAAAQYQTPVPSKSYQPKHDSQPQRLPIHQLATSPATSLAVPSEHPFLAYWGTPNDSQTTITGKPMSVVKLLAETRSPTVRCQLLQTYWELSGLLAVYHFRCETERQASGLQEGMMTLLREQRRTAEVEFIKQQWVLAELLKQYQGRMFRDSELPIPSDFPLYSHYQTHADRIARTERSRYLGRMIPIQEQLIESKNGTWNAASAMVHGGTQSTTQPFFMAANQRTMAFLELTKSIVEYNKMIAEYAAETIPPNASQQQFVAAVVRLQGRSATPEQSQPSLVVTEGIRLTHY